MRVLIFLLSINILALAGVNEAKEFYETGEYEKAIQEAKNSKEDYSNPQLHLVWAKSAYELDRKDESMSAYERTIILEENDKTGVLPYTNTYDELKIIQDDYILARIALLKIYRETDRDDLAAQMVNDINDFQLTDKQQYELSLLKDKNIDSLKTFASVVVGQDSNINASAGSDVLDDYLNTTGSPDKLSTTFVKFSGSLSYTNEFDRKGGAYVKGDLRLNYQNNIDESFYNLLVASVETGAGYSVNNFNIYLPVGFDTIYYLERSLLNQYKFTPKITISLDNIVLNINYSYVNRVYVEKADNIRDDKSVGGGIGMYYIFGKDFSYFNAKYENVTGTNANVANLVNKSVISASVGVNYRLLSWLVAKVDYKLRYSNYEDSIGNVIAPSNEKRSDAYNQIELKLSHNFSKNYELFFTERYAKNYSNYVPSEYSKNIVMLGLNIKY